LLIKNTLLEQSGDVALAVAGGSGGISGGFSNRPKPSEFVTADTVLIQGSLVRGSQRGGLYTWGSDVGSGMLIEGSAFVRNNVVGVYASQYPFNEGYMPNGYSGTAGLNIVASSILDTTGPALRLNTAGGSVARSLIVAGSGNVTGTSFGVSAASRTSDLFMRTGVRLIEKSNLFGVRAFDTGSGSDALDGRFNYWGTTSDSAIQSILWDWNDDSSLGFINYAPFLTSPSLDAPLLPPSGVTKASSGSGVRVSWNANSESDLAGYRVFWGSSDGFFWAHSAEVPSGTSFVIPNVGINERFAVAAYDTTRSGVSYNDRVSGHESWPTEAVAP